MPTQNKENPELVRVVSDLESPSDITGMAGSVYDSTLRRKVHAMSLKWDQGNARGGGLVRSYWPQAPAQMAVSSEDSGVVRPKPGNAFVTIEDVLEAREQAERRDKVAKRAREEDSPFSSSSSSSSQPPPSKRQQTTHSAFANASTPGTSSSTPQDLGLLRGAALRATDSELERRMIDLRDSILQDSARGPKGKGKETMVRESSSSSEAVMDSWPDPDAGIFDLDIGGASSKDPHLTDGPNKGEKVVAIKMAEANRPYTTYEDVMGMKHPGRGVLIPANYKKHNDPARPFICPVRDCRRIFPTLHGLGGHFAAGHCASVFNDNGDGTLTKVGSYANVGLGGSPGLVVSRDPLPPNAPPPKEPSLSYTEGLKRSQNHSSERRPRWVIGASGVSPSAPMETPVPIPTPFAPFLSTPPASGSDVKSYLHSFLIPNQRIYKRMDVRHMLTLERKRNLPQSWILTHRGSDLDATHYACALAYLTGEEETGDGKCNANEREGRGPSARLADRCIRLPQSMPKSAQRTFCSPPSCVGCKYWSYSQRQELKCDWHGVFALNNNPIVQGYMNRAREQPSSGPLVISVPSSSELDSTSDLGQGSDAELSLGAEHMPNFDSEPEEVPAFDSNPEPEPEPELEPEIETKSEPGPEPEPEPEPAPMIEDDEDSVIGARRTKRKVTAPASYSLARARRDPAPKAPSMERVSEDAPLKASSKTPLEAPSEVPLEMEDWEVAPGRMTDASAQNVAYSNSYLTSGQPVTVSEDISFNVVVIKPGSSKHWDTEKSKLRTISVAAGKVRITMDDKTFNLGSNGMFVISPGQSCKLENRVYVDSVLHCTTIANF